MLAVGMYTCNYSRKFTDTVGKCGEQNKSGYRHTLETNKKCNEGLPYRRLILEKLEWEDRRD